MIGWLYCTVKPLLQARTIEEHLRQILRRGECRTALDIGCGSSSDLTPFRPGLRTFGLDAFERSIAEARQLNLHDEYMLADILQTSTETILERASGQPFDLVMLSQVIEHFPKRQGFELLERCERLTSKYIVVYVPNGFLPQGPEFGNELQRHRSGWFPHDFQGLGYTVHGSVGTRLLRGYAGLLRYRFPGVATCDLLLEWLLRTETRPRHAFTLIAIKDVRGVPARKGVSANAKPAALRGFRLRGPGYY